jgi:hypothetical protein
MGTRSFGGIKLPDRGADYPSLYDVSLRMDRSCTSASASAWIGMSWDDLYLFTLSIVSVKLGRPRGRWEDNIRMNLWEVGCGCVDWMELAQDRDRWRALVSAVMNLRVP